MTTFELMQSKDVKTTHVSKSSSNRGIFKRKDWVEQQAFPSPSKRAVVLKSNCSKPFSLGGKVCNIW